MQPKQLCAMCVLTVLSLPGCSSPDPLPEQTELEGRPVIGHLRIRDQWITVYSSAAGPRFAIRTTAGRLLEDGLDLGQLAERYPEIHALYDSAIVGGDSSLDASVQPRERSADGTELTPPPLVRD